MNIDSQLLLDGASALGIQHLEGRHDDVFGVSTFQRRRERITLTEYNNDWKSKGEDGQTKGLLHTLQLLSKHGEENSEVDWAAGLLDHSLQLLILHVQLTYRERRGRSAQIHGCIYNVHNCIHTNINAPIEASTSLRSSLLMMPSLFWSMIVKAYVCRRDKRQEHCYRRSW